MTDLNLDAIEARANAATDGPWVVKHEPAWEADNVRHPDAITVGAQMWEGDDEPMTVCLVSTDHEDDPVDVLLDAEFIAHARTDVPVLVAEVRRLREAEDDWAAFGADMSTQRDEARAAIARVRALHFAEYDEHSDGNRCAECLAEYPCPTIRALDVRHDPSATTDGGAS